MALSDYAHHNEDAAYVWFQEEGRFGADEFDGYDEDGYDAYYGDEDYDEDDVYDGPLEDAAMEAGLFGWDA